MFDNFVSFEYKIESIAKDLKFRLFSKLNMKDEFLKAYREEKNKEKSERESIREVVKIFENQILPPCWIESARKSISIEKSPMSKKFFSSRRV